MDKNLFLKIANVKDIKSFYKKFPDQKSFFKAHPEAKEIIAQYQQQEIMANAPENSQEQMMGTEEEMVEQMAMGGMIKRKDGSYSKRGLWDNIRANKGSGKKPTKQMLEQAKKIQAEEMMYGGMVDNYPDGGGINNPGFKALPKSVQENIIANMAMGGMVDSYYNGGGINNKGFKALPKAVQENIISNMSMGGEVEEYADGGGIPQRYKNMGFTKVGQKKQGDGKHKWKVLAKKDDKYKVVQGGWRGMQDFKQHKSEKRRDNFWSRMGGKDSAKAKDPFSPLYWHKRFGTWADGGILPEVEQLMLAGQNPYNMGGYVEYPTYYPGGGMVGSDMIDYQADYNYPTMYPGGGMIAGPMMGYEEDDFMYAMGGGININPANEGKFTEWAAKRGMTVQEAANKVMTNRSKYTADVVKMANFAKNAAGWKKAMGGRIYQEGGMLNSMTEGIPVQTETFEGQAEQVALPDGTIKSVEATTAHENMGDDTVTDLLPGGSHIQSARNKLTPDQYVQLMQMFKPESAEQDIKKLAQVYQSKYGKKNGKKLSPADISEYAKNKYQNKSTPNSFDTDKLKEGNKKSYLDLSIQMNDLIKSGKELAEGAVMEEQMMAYGGMIPKYQTGTNKSGITESNKGITFYRPELDEFGNPVDFNQEGTSNYFPNFSRGLPVSNKLTTPEDWNILSPYVTIQPNSMKNRILFPQNLSLAEKLAIEGAAERYDLTNLTQGYTPGTGEKFSSGLTGKDFEQKLALTALGSEEYNKIKNNPSKIREVAYQTIGFNPTKKVNYNDPEFYSEFRSAFESAIPENMRPFFKNTGPMGLDYWNAIAPKAKPTPVAVAETPQTPAQKAAAQKLAANTPIAPAARVPMQNRFNFGLLEGQLGRGLSANQAALEAGLSLDPLYIMETPDTYIRSRKNEIPVGNILYNIERAQRNTANALAGQTGDWSTLASNISNAGAQAMNQVGDTLSKLNQTNVALYNETQGLQQDLLGSNMGVRNQNLTNMQNMLNFKRNLLGQKAVKDSEIYSEYAKSMGENAQKEQNQKLEMLNIMASKPDMFKGEQGQMFVNQILGNTGTYNNPLAGTLLDNILSANRYNR